MERRGIVRSSGACLAPIAGEDHGPAQPGVAALGGLPAAERVRVFVEEFLARSNQSLPMTRAEIGLHLGLAEETVVRALAKLR